MWENRLLIRMDINSVWHNMLSILLPKPGSAGTYHHLLSCQTPQPDNRGKSDTSDDERGKFCLKAARRSPNPCTIMADMVCSLGINESIWAADDIMYSKAHENPVSWKWLNVVNCGCGLTCVSITEEKKKNLTTDTFCVFCSKTITLSKKCFYILVWHMPFGFLAESYMRRLWPLACLNTTVRWRLA